MLFDASPTSIPTSTPSPNRSAAGIEYVLSLMGSSSLSGSLGRSSQFVCRTSDASGSITANSE
eukprot:1347806-Amorphochlora_amoeboformis.AAC.1